MQLFITGVLMIFTLLLAIRSLEIIKIEKNFWLKIIAFSIIISIITIIIQNCWSDFKYFSLLFLIISLFVLLRFENNSSGKSIFSIFVSAFVYIILNMIFYPIIVWLFISIGITEKISYTTVVYIVEIPATIIIIKLINRVLTKKVIELIKNTVSNKFKRFIIVCISTNIIFLLLIINIFKKFFTTNKNAMLISVLSFLGYSIIFSIVTFVAIYNLRKSLLDDQREIDLKNVLEYNRNLEELYNDMRRFRHDYINILSSMAGYIEDGDINGLEKYFNEKIAPLSSDMDKKNLRIGYLQNIKIKEIKGVLLTKTLKAQEMGIDVFVDVEEDINDINMEVIHICTILGILLDNALEEASKFKDGYIKIGFVKKGKDLIIIVSNKTSEDTPPVYKVFEKGFSTKGENRGIGLNNLRMIISKYKNVFLDTSICKDEFRQVIEVQ